MFEELSLHILDIAMNSLAAGARTIRIAVMESAKHDWLILRVRDDGRGIDKPTLQKVLSSSVSTKQHRKKPIGLGLALLRQTSEMCGGTFLVRSAPDKGTTVTASMRYSHVDRPPVGDLSSTILALCAANPSVDVQLSYHSDETRFQFSSQESRKVVGRVPPCGEAQPPAAGSGPTAIQRSSHEPRRTQEAEGKSPATSRAA